MPRSGRGAGTRVVGIEMSLRTPELVEFMMRPQNRSLWSRLGNGVGLTLSRDQRERLMDVPAAQVIFLDHRKFRGDFRSSATHLGAGLLLNSPLVHVAREAAPR